MVEEVNVNGGDTDAGAHMEDEPDAVSLFAVDLKKGKHRKKKGKCKSFTKDFCCAMSWLLLPIACCVTCNTGGPMGNEG